MGWEEGIQGMCSIKKLLFMTFKAYCCDNVLGVLVLFGLILTKKWPRFQVNGFIKNWGTYLLLA